MITSSGPITAYRRYWLPELVVLAELAVATIVLFAATRLDIAAMRPFYHPGLSDPWPVGSEPLWSLLYHSAPWVTGSLAIGGAGLLVAGAFWEKLKRLRLYGLFILLCVVIGPGLIINVVLKDHWGRPRPRQTVEFGGRFEYAQPLIPSRTYGKSFPCGHCSVGYLYAVGWWLWRRRHPRRAFLSLAAGLVLGTLLGLGRMAGGAHFLSDALWSALIAYTVAHVLYFYALRIPAREDAREALYPLIERNPRFKTAAIAASVLLGAGIIAGGILANPSDRDLTARVSLADYAEPPQVFEVIADVLDVEVRFVTEPRGTIECIGNIHGFGLPTSRITAMWEYEERPVPKLTYRIEKHGLFTDIDGSALLRIPAGMTKITVRIKRGDITVVDGTKKLTGEGLPALDLHTDNGRVKEPEKQ